MDNCKFCNTPLKNTKNTFCNSSCAASFNNTQRPPRTYESKLKLAQKICELQGIEFSGKLKKPTTKNLLIQAKKQNLPYTPIRQCTYCKKYFNYSERKSTTCSDQCFLNVKTKLNYSGKKCEYNGITFDSSWEKELAIYLDTNSIQWLRPSTSLCWFDATGKERKYFPDFYLPKFNLYIDPKNKHVAKLQSEKLNYLKNHYNNILVGSLDEILACLRGLEPPCIQLPFQLVRSQRGYKQS